MAAVKDADLEFWIEFIEMYREMPSLWKVYSDQYKNKRLKQQCYSKMLEKLREIEPSATIDLVKRKINTFRSNYRREVNKVLNSKLKGQTYHPSVWYYKHLDFLYEDETNQGAEGEQTTDEFEESMDVKPIHINVDDVYEETNSPIDHYPYEAVETRRIKRFKPSTEVADFQPDSAGTYKTKIVQESPNKDNEVISQYWANELKHLDPDQKVFAQKAINDILFEGRMKTLNRYSVQINVDRNNVS